MELNKLKQGKLSVAEYTTKFLRLTRLVPNMDQESILFLYTHGLEPNTSREVRLRQPESLEYAIEQATILHNILNPTAPTALTSPNLPAKQTASAEPMDIDNLRVLLANIMNTTNVNALRQPIPKLTNAERERLRRIGACFRCRRVGHTYRSNQCRSGQAMNNMEMGANADDDVSGKDQGEA